MTDIVALRLSAEVTLLEVSKQAFLLATGLQNVAPGDEAREPSKSVAYLFAVAKQLEECYGKCNKLTGSSLLDQADKLNEYTAEAVTADVGLREQYQIKDKFRFIRDKIISTQEQVQAEVIEYKKVHVKSVDVLNESDVVVYVYLFNAQGMAIDTWRKMLIPAVFYDHSVNRPIYVEQSEIQSFINRKTNKLQHGYFSIAIKKTDILQTETPLKDLYGSVLIKVREGSLDPQKRQTFTHNEAEYEIDAEGNLAKKL